MTTYLVFEIFNRSSFYWFPSFKNKRWIAIVAACVLITACEQKTETPEQTTEVIGTAQPVTVDPATEAATEKVWEEGADILDNTLTETKNLRDAIQQLLSDPNTDTLSATQLAWHRAHDAYQRFQLYVAIGESNPGLFGQINLLNFAVDAWPIQPGFLDYFDIYEQSGMVNDIAMPLTADALRQQHGMTDASDVSVGFHAMEYLLWGEKGQRPVADFTEVTQLTAEQRDAELRVIDLPENRRRVLLQLMSELLIDDVQQTLTQWQGESAQLRINYLALQPNSRLELIRLAAIHWLETTLTHLEILNAQRDENNKVPDTTNAAELDTIEPLHNPYANNNANGLAQSLGTLKNWFFTTDDVLGLRVMEASTQTELADKLSTTSEQLYDWRDQPWPPNDDDKIKVVETLIALHEALNPVDESSDTIPDESANESSKDNQEN